ncbi:protein FAM107B isoform X2 [Nilaparvata lugens]|uniref:protein FAM107B isoform X2 n=1 Tax=Nilaparvata lugens TaxID=108931 RepID=UPI00193D2508|nr:protein FAM107B isoform X2 [Nilaparvata lugens]
MMERGVGIPPQQNRNISSSIKERMHAFEHDEDYDSEDSNSGGGMIMIPDHHQSNCRGGSQGGVVPPPPPPGGEALIVPRKIHNPCIESTDRQNLHRELLFNQRIGKNVLNQKSELQKALEKHKDNQARKEVEMQKQEEKTPLERVIEERARRLESYEKGSLENESKSSSEKPEFLQVHARLRARMDSK